MLPKFFLANSSRSSTASSGLSTVSTVSTDSGPSTPSTSSRSRANTSSSSSSLPSSSSPSLSSSNVSLISPPAIKPPPSQDPNQYRLPASILPSAPSGQDPKYRQPPTALIPYPRNTVDIIEALKQRRDDVPELMKWEWESRVEVRRVETVGGRIKRGWEKVVFWERRKKGRSEDEDEYEDHWE